MNIVPACRIGLRCDGTPEFFRKPFRQLRVVRDRSVIFPRIGAMVFGRNCRLAPQVANQLVHTIVFTPLVHKRMPQPWPMLLQQLASLRRIVAIADRQSMT